MGDRLGILGAVDTAFCPFLVEASLKLNMKNAQSHYVCLRPYHGEHTSSRLITEVKHHRAKVVLGWVTAWEFLVL
jgi:hypothetical protein